MSLEVAIAGAAGRMGARLLAACAQAQDLRVTAALEAPGTPLLGRDAGESAGLGHLGLALSASPAGDFDVLVDFSTPAGTRAWLAECVARGKPMVVGTTGHDADDLGALARAAERIALVRAPNMALGVNLLRRVVRDVAAKLEQLGLAADVEIVDVHHRHKRDAPSGTGLVLAEDARLGKVQPTIHSLRMGSRPGDHAVHFGLPDETLTLAHSAHSRRPFVDGALHAARWVVARAPGSYDMQDVLFGAP